jgi:hypothetical protein
MLSRDEAGSDLLARGAQGRAVSARAVPNEGQRQRYGGRVSPQAAPKELARSDRFHHRATGVGDTCDPRSTSGRQAPRRIAHDAGVNRRLLKAISPDKPAEGPSRYACRQAAHGGLSQASCQARRVQGPSHSTREQPLPRTGGQRLVPAQAPIERADSPARPGASAFGAWGAATRATPPEGSLLTSEAKRGVLRRPRGAAERRCVAPTKSSCREARCLSLRRLAQGDATSRRR